MGESVEGDRLGATNGKVYREKDGGTFGGNFRSRCAEGLKVLSMFTCSKLI
jgi:hypothetical protein